MRLGRTHEGSLVARCVHLALSWNPERAVPGGESLLAHPEVSIYHRGWGRPGDTLVIAETTRGPIGYAFARLFDPGEHGHGYVDRHTPEMGVAVEPGRRRRGVGRRLVERLHTELAAAGRPAVSLSVEVDNPAKTLCEELGYQAVAAGDGALVMVKRLA